jgi:hypothetical protein
MSLTRYATSSVIAALVAFFAITSTQPALAQSRINDKVSRNNGASFFANERASRNIQHARDYSRGIQRYTTQAPMIQHQVTQAESQILGQQLQGIQRDMVIVREEHASNPKVVEQVKKIETKLTECATMHKSLHEECCKETPDGNVCSTMATKLNASLEQIKKEHDMLLKELGQEEAAHGHHSADHDHGSAASKTAK